MTAISFTVIGIPAPQGSKTPWGSEANPNTRPWRAAVAADAVEAMRTVGVFEGEVLTGPVRVQATFTFPRPKAHYRTGRNAGELRPDAPRWHTGTPDLDKLQRAIGDALTGTVLRDDKQIAEWHVIKVYGAPAAAEISVMAITALPDRRGVEAAA